MAPLGADSAPAYFHAMNPTLALEFVLLAALWGSSFLFMRLGAAEFGIVPTAGLRVALAALFLLPVFLVKGVWADFRARARPILFVGLLNSGIPFALFAYAVLHITTGLSSILNATVPLTGALVAWLWLKDRPGGSRMLGLGVGFAGVTLLVIGKSGFSATGVAGSMSPGSQPWLIAKIIGLIAYIGLGVAAFKMPNPTARKLLWVSALIVFAYIVSVAISKNPLGFFS